MLIPIWMATIYWANLPELFLKRWLEDPAPSIQWLFWVLRPQRICCIPCLWACGQEKREKANWRSWILCRRFMEPRLKKLRCSPFTTLNCLGLEAWLENIAFHYSGAKMKWLCTLNIVSAINVFLAKVFLPLHIKYQSSDEEIVKMEIEWLCIHKLVVTSSLNQKVFK